MSELSSHTSVSTKLARLSGAQQKQLGERAAVLYEMWVKLKRGNWQDSDIRELTLWAHNLVGSAGTFGAYAASQTARELELAFRALLGQKKPPNEARQAEITRLIAELSEAIALRRYPATQAVEQTLQHDEVPHHQSNTVFLVDDDVHQTSTLAAELELSGYQVQVFLGLEAFNKACCQAIRPVAIIMDMVFPEGDDAGAKAISEMKEKCWANIPVVFVSARDDIDAQLAAIRAGATRYITKPVDVRQFVDTLDELTLRTSAKPYRVLIVDDDASLASEYAALLNDAGMTIRILTDPLQAVAATSAFQPEVLITDVYMSGCSGLELAVILRRDDAFAELPILFLSSEADFGRQLAALNLGGDDVLALPVDPTYLVAVVMARAKRARHVNRLVGDLRKALKEKEYQQFAMDRHAIVSIADTAGNIIYANAKFCEASGYSQNELLGHNHRIVKSDYHSPDFYKEMWLTVAGGEVWHGEMCNQRKDGNRYWVESTIVPFLDEDGSPYQYVSVRTDISELKNTEAKLISAKEDAEKANRAKSEFLSGMSHELRTPMNAILGFAQLLEMDSEQPLTLSQQDRTHEILKAGRHLLVLINEVLDLAKVEAGHLDVSIEPVELSEVCQECLALIAPLAEIRNIDIVWDESGCRDLVVRADRTRLKQVLLNLVSNAVKYNREGGNVTVQCRQSNKTRLHIAVTDTGPGISAERQTELFKPFSRLGAEYSDVEGTGIGLLISKQLIELMGGCIGVESEPGVGSTFWIELESDLITQPDEAATQFVDYASRLVPVIDDLLTVLYVEDNPANLKLVSLLFARLPHIRLYTAHTPVLGLELAQAHRPGLILLDIQLPGMDGYTVLRRLRAQDETRHIPVVAITANAMPRDIKKGRSAGFDGYITKPINVPHFFEVMEQVLAKGSTRKVQESYGTP